MLLVVSILLVNFGEISVARIKVNALCIYVSFSVLLHKQIVLNETSFLALRTQGKGVVKCIKVNLKKENVFEYALESAVLPLFYSIEHRFGQRSQKGYGREFAANVL